MSGVLCDERALTVTAHVSGPQLHKQYVQHLMLCRPSCLSLQSVGPSMAEDRSVIIGAAYEQSPIFPSIPTRPDLAELNLCFSEIPLELCADPLIQHTPARNSQHQQRLEKTPRCLACISDWREKALPNGLRIGLC